MNWSRYRNCPWVDSRAAFVSRAPAGGQFLDIGCSDCQTLRHLAELRPDLRFTAVDLLDRSALVPPQMRFARLDITTDRFPFADNTFDSVTFLHVMEHLRDDDHMAGEIVRVMKPGGCLYVEGPSRRSLGMPHWRGAGPLNFFDDPSHVAPITAERVTGAFVPRGMTVTRVGRSRSWPLILALPWSLLKGDRYHYLTGIFHLCGCALFVELRKTQT
jgi:SAM-dependent methyltransferase